MEFGFHRHRSNEGLIILFGNAQGIPKLIVPVTVFIGDPAIEVWTENNFSRSIQWGYLVIDHSQLVRIQMENTGTLHRNFRSVSHGSFERSFVVTFLHIQFSSEIAYIGTIIKIQVFSIHRNFNPNPVWGVQNFSEVFRIPVLPPSHTRFVRVIYPGHVASLEGRA